MDHGSQKTKEVEQPYVPLQDHIRFLNLWTVWIQVSDKAIFQAPGTLQKKWKHLSND